MFRITILSSDEDIASQTIRAQLLKYFPFKETQKSNNSQNAHILKEYKYQKDDLGGVEVSMLVIDCRMSRLDETFKKGEIAGDMLIFISRHSSKSGKGALLCHTPGNWGDNKYGGQKKTIAKGSGVLLHYFHQMLSEYLQESETSSFVVDQEVTHHGPTLFDIPMAFIELGSDKKGWKNSEGGKIVANAVMKTTHLIAEKHISENKFQKSNVNVCVGFGGTHYMYNLSKLIKLGCGFVHTVPKYHIKKLTNKMIKNIQERSMEPIDYWVIDWKGVNSAQKVHLLNLLEKNNLQYIKRKKLQKKLKHK